jgi:hypothetical protein
MMDEDMDSRIVSACAFSENHEVLNLLSQKPSWNALLQCFHMALALENVELIMRLLPSLNSLTPNGKRGLYLNLFKEYATEGSKPEIINALQQLLRPTDLAEQHRLREALRKQGKLQADSFYLVDDVELFQLKEIKLKLSRHQVSGSGSPSSSRRERWFNTLKQQNWINDCFLNVSQGDRRLLVSYLVNLPRESSLCPSQSTVNAAFGRCCESGLIGMAGILVAGVNQAGFDEAVVIADAEKQPHILTWLLSGRLGFAPSEYVVDDLYQERLRQLLHRADAMEQHARPRSRRARGQPSDSSENMAEANECFRMLGVWVAPAVREGAEQALQLRRDEAKRARLRGAAARTFHIDRGADIHDYSASAIQPGIPSAAEPAELEPQNQFPRMQQRPRRGGRGPGGGTRSGLNEAVLDHIYTRVPVSLYRQRYESTEAVIHRLGELVDTHIPPAHHSSAMRIIGDLLNEESSRMFGFIIAFLEILREDDAEATHEALGAWIQGFLTESIQMHSCNPGAMERAVTGLRGVGDSQLDAIFSQAEGPRLVNLFLRGSFNIFDEENARRNGPRLAQELVSRNATAATTSNEILQMLTAYATEQVATFGVDPNEHLEEIRVIMEMLSDNYDTHLKSYVLTEINHNVN